MGFYQVNDSFMAEAWTFDCCNLQGFGYEQLSQGVCVNFLHSKLYQRSTSSWKLHLPGPEVVLAEETSSGT